MRDLCSINTSPCINYKFYSTRLEMQNSSYKGRNAIRNGRTVAPFRPALPRILGRGPSLSTVALRSTAVERRYLEIILAGF